jgi:hypothetical protein
MAGKPEIHMPLRPTEHIGIDSDLLIRLSLLRWQGEMQQKWLSVLRTDASVTSGPELAGADEGPTINVCVLADWL